MCLEIFQSNIKQRVNNFNKKENIWIWDIIWKPLESKKGHHAACESESYKVQFSQIVERLSFFSSSQNPTGQQKGKTEMGVWHIFMDPGDTLLFCYFSLLWLFSIVFSGLEEMQCCVHFLLFNRGIFKDIRFKQWRWRLQGIVSC